jgi:hypothetical protein
MGLRLQERSLNPFAQCLGGHALVPETALPIVPETALLLVSEAALPLVSETALLLVPETALLRLAEAALLQSAEAALRKCPCPGPEQRHLMGCVLHVYTESERQLAQWAQHEMDNTRLRSRVGRGEGGYQLPSF